MRCNDALLTACKAKAVVDANKRKCQRVSGVMRVDKTVINNKTSCPPTGSVSHRTMRFLNVSYVGAFANTES